MAKIAEGLAIKLQPFIGDKGVRYSKSCNYILPYELFDINVSNVGQGFSLYPLSEVVSSY